MRIIAGRLKGRVFESPHGRRTHPMSDKIRGALFNTLGDIEGLTICDPFSGSGALSYEAISRGATFALAIESDRQAQIAITQNIRSLDLKKEVKLVSASAAAWLLTTDDTFDIILLDPPYDDLQPVTLKRLAARTKPSGIIVCSLPPKTDINLGTDFHLLSHKTYGDAELTFYRRT